MFKIKVLLIICVIGLSGCYALNHPEATTQPVVYKSDKTLFTTCSGAVEDWSNCQSKAKKSCTNGYAVIERAESPVAGKRELTFKCN